MYTSKVGILHRKQDIILPNIILYTKYYLHCSLLTQIYKHSLEIIASKCMLHKWNQYIPGLTHWGRVTHIRISKLNIIGSYNGLSPGRRQAIFWTNAGILLIWPLGTILSEMFIEIHTFSFKKMHVKKSRLWKGGHFVSASMC